MTEITLFNARASIIEVLKEELEYIAYLNDNELWTLGDVIPVLQMQTIDGVTGQYKRAPDYLVRSNDTQVYKIENSIGTNNAIIIPFAKNITAGELVLLKKDGSNYTFNGRVKQLIPAVNYDRAYVVNGLEIAVV